MRLFHPHYGYLSMASEDLAPNQWVGHAGVRYGTFWDGAGNFLALPLADVQVS